MAKAVFRPEELVRNGPAVSLEAPFTGKTDVKDETGAADEAEPVYDGPTADDLRREAEDFRVRWEAEKDAMLASAHNEAEIIVNDAKKAAATENEKAEAELRRRKQSAETEAATIVDGARTRAAQIEAAAVAKLAEAVKSASADGFEQGRKDGYESGMTEARRLAARAQLIMERIQDKRLEIIEQAEREIIDLALLVARKVVKIISESQRQVVVENIKEALGKIKTKGSVTVRVNTDDLETASEHKDEFLTLLESSGGIRILEDSSVDSGGCYVETDFGEVDARIAVQFAELESKILELSPVKTRRGAS